MLLLAHPLALREFCLDLRVREQCHVHGCDPRGELLDLRVALSEFFAERAEVERGRRRALHQGALHALQDRQAVAELRVLGGELVQTELLLRVSGERAETTSRERANALRWREDSR